MPWGAEYETEESISHKFTAGFGIPQAGQPKYNESIYAPLTGVTSLFEKYQVPSDLYLSAVPDLQGNTKINV
ncbi:hypothetical protein [Algicola sagamiensis]|uniref:hypothetical protein n=1 Tax=Algicola sagamiensis TaxID=163869 RepID=UPI00035D0D95|nr:hypothetical protein [Algicola sagamiensis]